MRAERLDAAYRAAHGRVLAALVRRFGVATLAIAEESLQEAYLRALDHWREDESGSLEGWLLRVAHNRVVDVLRRERRATSLEDRPDVAEGVTELAEPEVDDDLRTIFYCCHPVLPRAAQIALTLRIAFGFETKQIAHAFLSDDGTIAQRIVRAKERLRAEKTRFELPDPAEVGERLPPILDVLYQVFSEGHATTGGDTAIDDALCRESLRLVRLLTEDARWTTPEAEALRALFCFHVARGGARVADDGSLLLLHEQDRGRWDPELLAEGFVFLARSAHGDALSRFHLEAGIAACHARATSFAATDWSEIVALYDALREVSPSPVVDVNRALAVAMLRGANAGLDELDAIPERDLVQRYPYALATYAELYASQGRLDEARRFLDRALALQTSAAERALLVRKRAALA